MSAFMCCDFHLNAMVTFAAAPRGAGLGDVTPGKEEAVANLLREANRAALRSRYGAESALEVPARGRYAPTRLLRPSEFVAACKCFEYQACEVDGYEATPAGHLVAAWIEQAKLAWTGTVEDPDTWEVCA